MQLYDYHRSSASYRVRIALNLKAIDWQEIPVDLLHSEQTGEAYREINPQALVPALALADGQMLTQSGAILEWLEESYPKPALLPESALDRARVRAMANIICCDIHPLNNLRVLKYITGELGASEEQKMLWYRHWLAQGFAALEAQVRGSKFSFGADVSLADVCLVPQMYNARRFELDLAPYPRLVAICANLQSIPAFAAAAPEV